MPTSFQLRRGPYLDWLQKNPRLRAGEMGYEIGTGRYKIGDGLRNWVDLPYFTNEEVIKQYVDDEIAALAAGVSGLTIDDLNTHINDTTPHPEYDEGPSLLLLYENAKV
jgi:hypothetical protein